MPSRAAAIGAPRADQRAARETENTSVVPAKSRLLEMIKAKSLLVGEFKLVSGAVSDYYLDMKLTMFGPEGAHLVAQLVCDLIADERDVEAIGGVELGAVPIIIAVCAQLARPPRRRLRRAQGDQGPRHRVAWHQQSLCGDFSRG